jgi:hypothetical protein
MSNNGACDGARLECGCLVADAYMERISELCNTKEKLEQKLEASRVATGNQRAVCEAESARLTAHIEHAAEQYLKDLDMVRANYAAEIDHLKDEVRSLKQDVAASGGGEWR